MPLNPSSSDIYTGYAAPVAGFQTFATTTPATTVLTIPAGRIFSGTVAINCSCTNAGAATNAAQATGVVSISGTGAVPAAGNYWRCDALAGANVTAGTVGDDGNNNATFPNVVIQAGSANALIQLTTTNVGTNSQVSASAYGVII